MIKLISKSSSSGLDFLALDLISDQTVSDQLKNFKNFFQGLIQFFNSFVIFFLRICPQKRPTKINVRNKTRVE